MGTFIARSGARALRARAVFAARAFSALFLAACAGGDTIGPSGDFHVDPASFPLLVGQTVQLTAVDAPGTVRWSSSDATIASVVPETGFVTAQGRGVATISAVSKAQVASATITVTVPPAIALATPTLAFDVTQGDADPAPQTVAVTNAGDGTLAGLAVGAVQYAEGQPQGWLSAQLSGATAPATLTVGVSAAGLPLGTYSAVVPVSAQGVDNSPQNVVVTFRVLAPPSIALSRSVVPMSAIPEQTVEETIDVTNGGGRPLTGLSAGVAYAAGQPQGWLEATLDATAAPATLTLRATSGSMPLGTYDATVTVASDLAGVAAKTIAVHFTLSPGPAIHLDRTAVHLAASPGTDAAPVDVAVTNGGGGTLSGLAISPVTYGAGQPTGWLAAALGATTAPTTLTLTPATASLPQGTYTATVTLSSPVASNSPLAVEVTLDIAPPARIAVNPASLAFSSFQGASIQPNPQGVSVTNSGGGTLSGLSSTVSYDNGAGWLQLTWQGGNTTAPATLIVQPVTGALAEGTYTATITISTDISGVASKAVGVTFTVRSFTTDVYSILGRIAQAATSRTTHRRPTCTQTARSPRGTRGEASSTAGSHGGSPCGHAADAAPRQLHR